VTWAGVLLACAACYALKLAGLSLPAGVLEDPRVQRTVPLVPVALDVRAAALAVAIVAVLLRAPFLVVVAAAAATAAVLRLL